MSNRLASTARYRSAEMRYKSTFGNSVRIFSRKELPGLTSRTCAGLHMSGRSTTLLAELRGTHAYACPCRPSLLARIHTTCSRAAAPVTSISGSFDHLELIAIEKRHPERRVALRATLLEEADLDQLVS